MLFTTDFTPLTFFAIVPALVYALGVSTVPLSVTTPSVTWTTERRPLPRHLPPALFGSGRQLGHQGVVVLAGRYYAHQEADHPSGS